MLSKDLQSFYRHNSFFRLLKQLRLEIISDMEACETIWNEFSPYETLFDTWDFRYAFWEAFQCKPHFITLKSGEDNVGLLPLWFDDNEKDPGYRWFGSEWHEENYFWVKDSLFIPILLSSSPTPLSLNAISSTAIDGTDQIMQFEEDTIKYYLDLTQINSLDDFLSLLTKKRRYNLKRDYRKIDSKKPEIIIDNFTDVNELMRLSQERFSSRGIECFWDDPNEASVFLNMAAHRERYKQFTLRMLTVKIDGKVAGVDLIAIFKNSYYPFICGYDVKNHSGIGAYFTVIELLDALKLNMKRFDVLEGNYNWKDRYFTPMRMYKYERKKTA